MPRLLKSLVLSSAFVLGVAGLAAHAGPVEDARYAADVAQAEWQRSRCTLDDAVEQLRVATARRDALAGELDGTMRQIAQWPAELERIRADIRRMEQDLSQATGDEQRIAADLEQMRADLNRAERALEAVRQAAVGECVGIGQYRDALAWRARCIDRIELRRQVARGPLMSWPSYRELFEQFNTTRSELEKLKTTGAGESQIKPVQERLDRIVGELRGYEDDALTRDSQALDARAELERAERELDRLQASIDRQLDRNPSVLASKRRIDAINASIEQATRALQQVRQQRARIEQALLQAREAERCYANGPGQLQSRACALREQLAEADEIVRCQQGRVAQLQAWECALRERRDQAQTHYQYVLATYCPPASSRPRLVVAGDPDTHDYRDGRPRPSDPSRRPTASREGAGDDSRDRSQQASRATPRRTSPDGAESRRDADRTSRVSRDNAASAGNERSSRSSGGGSPPARSERGPRRAAPQERG